MARVTIDVGIHLGTEYAQVAVLRGAEVEVLENNEGFEFTPSAVWIDPQNHLYVGRHAKQMTEADPDNSACEFKTQMGMNVVKTFARSGRRMKPEELSAMVLKSLRATVKLRTGEDIEAAVITVPAAFELPQNDATKRAAVLAGLKQSPLLIEPVAAALAYGFGSESDKVFWLVYDFGGGTFDAAVMHVCDGSIQVVNHEGDNMLGSKLIDWAIVEELLIPAVTRKHRLTDFHRGNVKWRTAIAKLKLEAEEAIIRLSTSDSIESTVILIDFLCLDDLGVQVRFEYELSRKDVEKLAEPLILRSINICKKVLAEVNLVPRDVEKLILVGGPTSMPYLRARLADPCTEQYLALAGINSMPYLRAREGLGIPLEFSVDPLTVMARGAAIFAGTQRLKDGPPIMKRGQFYVELDYKPMGSEFEQIITFDEYGKVDLAEIKKDLETEKKRLDEMRRVTEETNDPTARTLLERIDRERMLDEVEARLAAAADPEAGQKAKNRLGDLKVALDEIEDAVELSEALRTLEEELKDLYD